MHFSQFVKINLVVSKLLCIFTSPNKIKDMTQTVNQYADQIESIVAYAKSINFDPNTGNYDDLFCKWNLRMYRMSIDIQNNREDVFRLIKSMTKH